MGSPANALPSIKTHPLDVNASVPARGEASLRFGSICLGDAVGVLGADVVGRDQLGQDAQAQELHADDQERDRVGSNGRWPIGRSPITQRTAR